MKLLLLPVALALAAGTALAGGVDIKINKDAIVVSPIGPQGVVTVQGMPGAVMGGMPPIQITAQSKKSKLSSAGMVGPDGSFTVQVPSMLKDSIKLTFFGADGKKKDHKVKVVSMGEMLVPPPQGQAGMRTDTVTVPAGGPAAPAAPEPQMVPAGQAPPPPPVTHSGAQSDSQIITGEKELNASGVVE